MRHAVIICVCCAVASADPPPELYRDIATGFRAYEAGDYTSAIAAFERAHAHSPDPRLLYALGNAQRKAGDCPAAIRSYEAFLASGSTATLGEAATTPALRDLSAQNIAACNAELAQRRAATSERLLADTRTQLAETDAERDMLRQRLLALASVTVAKRVPLPWYRDRIGHVLAASGIACAGAGLALWWVGRERANAVGAAPDHAEYLDRLGAASAAVREQQIGIGLAATGAALVLGGVLRYVSRKEVTIMVNPLSDGVALSASGGL
jgi:tetratricopeptide (TPR) repeat protein